MIARPFTLQFDQAQEADDSAHTVALSGYFDANTVQEFEDIAEIVLHSTCNQLILDIHQLNHISSAGIGAMMALLQQLRCRGGNMVLVQPAPRVQRTLEMLGFTTLLAVAPNRANALQILAQAATTERA